MQEDEIVVIEVRISPREALHRGVKKLCPRCGKGGLYLKWNTLEDYCPVCHYDLERRTGDTWFYTYMTTAFITGLIVLVMLFFPPKNHLLGQILIVIAWFVFIVMTLPYRKSLALAIEYYFEHRNANANELDPCDTNRPS